MAYADMIDANAVRIVNSFDDMARWPITAGITRLELRPGRGLVVHYVDATPPWPDYHLDNDLAAGLVRSTLCAGFRINGQWVMSGFMNYWAHEGRIRTDSGAHPLEIATDKGINQWQANWVYNASWAPLSTYVPKAGDLIAVMLAAGGTRQSKTRTVNERTQIVTIPLQMDGAWDFQPTTPDPVPDPDPTPDPTPDPDPVPPSLTPVTIDASQYDALIARFDSLDRQFADARADVKTGTADLLKQLPALLRKALLGR